MYFFGFLSCAWLGQKDSTSWSLAQSLLVVDQAAIHQIKEESQAFHMSPKTRQMIKKPANSGLSLIHNCSCLVFFTIPSPIIANNINIFRVGCSSASQDEVLRLSSGSLRWLRFLLLFKASDNCFYLILLSLGRCGFTSKKICHRQACRLKGGIGWFALFVWLYALPLVGLVDKT